MIFSHPGRLWFLCNLASIIFVFIYLLGDGVTKTECFVLLQILVIASVGLGLWLDKYQMYRASKKRNTLTP